MADSAVVKLNPHIPSVLLVEDDPGNLTFLQLLLEMANCSFTAVQTGAEALAHLQKSQFDLVLLDLHLPDMDGFTFCKQAQQQQLMATTRIVGISANVDARVRSRCLEAGMQGLHHKALEVGDIDSLIARYVSTPAAV